MKKLSLPSLRSFAIPFALTMAIIGMGVQGHSFSSSTTTHSATFSYDTQISDDVHQAIRQNAVAATYQNWILSGFTPSEIFVNAQALRATHSLCKALRSLQDSQLTLFENILRDSRTAKQLRCSPALTQRLNHYWQKSRHQITQALGVINSEPQSPSTQPRIWTGSPQPQPGEVALIFEGGPHPSRTRAIVEALRQHGMRANFFLSGSRISSHPEAIHAVLQELIQNGNVIGSRSMTPAFMPMLDMRTAEDEVRQSHDEILGATGIDAKLFRFPFGAQTEALGHLIQEEHQIAFDPGRAAIDSQDWKIRDPLALEQRVWSELEKRKGGIVLFHDTEEQTSIALPYLLDQIRRQGYKTVVFTPN